MSLTIFNCIRRHALTRRELAVIGQLRNNSSSSKEKVGKKIENYSETEASGRRNVRGYLFHRFFDYVQNYDKIITKRFPKAMKVYRVFMDGVKDFYKDMKLFMAVTKEANSSGLRSLTRTEIECYHQMPKDMAKVAPVLIISALPFMNYVVFPLAYMYPRTFLTSHFWSLQQRNEFRTLYLKERFLYNKPVFRHLQARLGGLKKQGHIEYHEKMDHILGQLGSGMHPHVNEILEVKDVFAKPPYNLESLGTRHLTYLCHMHGLHTWYFKRGRLAERSYLVHHMDLAIKREGGPEKMEKDALVHSCYLRGLNPANLSETEMMEWLNQWIQVSSEVVGDNVSLYLHMPILLGYNHPNNWLLIH